MHKGLTEKEASELLLKYGPNEIEEINKSSALKILLRQIKKNFIIYLFLVAATLSFLVGKSITGYAILAIIILVIGTTFFQEYKAEKAVDALKGLVRPTSVVIREGTQKTIYSKELVAGDIILLRSGERIPADCIVLEEKEILIDESILTGESKEVKKTALRENQKESEAEKENMIYMGSYVVNGRGIAKVLHTGMNTQFGKIANLITKTEKTLPLQIKINEISKYMIIIAITVSMLTGAILLLTAPTIDKALLVEISVLIIALAVSAFPEGLPVVLITSLSLGAWRMAQKNAIVNRMSIIETLGETTVICSDKTGTITKGEMTVKKIFLDNTEYDLSGTGYTSKGEFTLEKKKIDINNETGQVGELFFKAATLCNDARIKRSGEDHEYSIIGSPTEAALLIMSSKAGIYEEDIKNLRLEEIPFNSKRKIMSVLSKISEGTYIFTKGAPEIVINKCTHIQRKNGIFTLTQKERERILQKNLELNNQAFRTLTLAYKKIEGKKKTSKDNMEESLIFLGLAGIKDPPREEVKEAIKLCTKAGITVKMITGDNESTAKSIAQQIGLSTKILQGYEIDKITDDELKRVVQEIGIFARVNPEHKLRIVKALKANGEIVTMTGDGVNDAPALKEAHIGVAMGKGGTDVSRSVADLTLKDDNFATIVSAINEGRTVFNNIRKFVSYQLSCNHAELFIIFIGVLLSPLLGWQIPVLLALQILFMNIVTDNLPAITLSFNKASSDNMDKKPRRNAQIITKPILYLILFTGVFMGILSLLAFFIATDYLHKDIEVARTITLITLIFLEIGAAYTFRSFRKPTFTRDLMANPYLFWASLTSIIATIIVVYTPLNKIFGTTPISLKYWMIALGITLLLVGTYDLLKYINNKKRFFKIE